MKKIYLEKQFMKATDSHNYIVGEIVAHSKEKGLYQIEKEDGSILNVFSHSILGWEEYKEDKKTGYRFHYYAKENEITNLKMFYCSIYKDGKFFYRYSYDVKWLHVFSTGEAFRHFLVEQGYKADYVIDKSWYDLRAKDELFIEKRKDGRYAIMFKNNKKTTDNVEMVHALLTLEEAKEMLHNYENLLSFTHKGEIKTNDGF